MTESGLRCHFAKMEEFKKFSQVQIIVHFIYFIKQKIKKTWKFSNIIEIIQLICNLIGGVISKIQFITVLFLILNLFN